MKKSLIILINSVLIAGILVFVVIYSHYVANSDYRLQREAFEGTEVAMERMTENYLSGEQRICDVWAQYIDTNAMTMEEAAAFIRMSHVLPDTSAHIIDVQSRVGVSTRPKLGTEDDYRVSYERIDLFGDLSWIAPVGSAINITRAYTNPINGEQSLAFCNRISLRGDDGADREALLMRVVPIDELEERWIFPQEHFKTAEYSIIDAQGNYIIRGHSFKNSSFFEFYKSYNQANAADIQQLFETIASGSGSFVMMDSRNRSCVVAYTPIHATEGWILLSYLPEEDLDSDSENWVMVGIIAAGLVALFLLDLFYMLYLNRSLRAMAVSAESANKAKTDFLSTMSHDIRTPMNAIIGLTTLAERNLNDTEAVGDNLRKISLASRHLLTLINDILDISKVESGKLTLSPVTFSIVETVENLVNLSQPMIKEKNIDFNFRTNRMEKEYLYADQLRLNQIYINILSNAIKYTEPRGSVSVDLREQPSDKPGCVRLTYVVSDTGIGMTREFMEKMYQPFSRQTDSRVNSIQGTGLGLAITKQMVELMHGTIECKSAPGEGTTFTIVLDIPVAERQHEEMKLSPIDVLIADDDEVLLETAADILESLGAHADRIGTGREAIDMIKRRHSEGRDYGVVIVDWKMPDMDGVETVQRIRREVDASVPILLISAYDWSDIEDAAREAGVSGFIAKPLFRSKLYEKINELLGVQASSADPEDDYSDLAGMRILVAEDNDINWEIISAMLAMFGIDTERAENGRICVDKMRAAEEGRYGLIFMDVQMPEMNGLDATRSIRALDKPWAAGIPIVAMTADAFSENVTECMNADMNGHIAKPVDIKLVIKEIRRINEKNRRH